MARYGLQAMRYIGSKSGGNGASGLGRWIANEMLPAPESCDLYVEPFAGMLGVLLQRAPARAEIVNDLDGRVVNWWLVVRDRHEELARLLALTPRSRELFERACEDAETDPVRRALDFTILCQSAYAGKHEKSAWGIPPANLRRQDWRRGLHDRLYLLAERMQNVTLGHRDAVNILERIAREKGAVVYVDPPYAGTVGYDGVYAHVDDRAALTDVLRAQQGRVAVSGYGTEWDELGWQRHEFATYSSIAGAGAQRKTEVCWTNYEIAQRPLALEGV